MRIIAIVEPVAVRDGGRADLARPGRDVDVVTARVDAMSTRGDHGRSRTARAVTGTGTGRAGAGR